MITAHSERSCTVGYTPETAHPGQRYLDYCTIEVRPEGLGVPVVTGQESKIVLLLY